MLLKASFKHKVPKHILAKQINQAFFEIRTKAKYEHAADWASFDSAHDKYADMGPLFFVPGTHINFISISAPLNINNLIFLGV